MATNGHGSEPVYDNYKPIHRISQACTSCRRKKARCTGERPKCENCRRLATDCNYQEVSPASRKKSSNGVDSGVSPSPDVPENLSKRLSTIEALLHDLKSQMQSVVSLQSKLSPSNASYQHHDDNIDHSERRRKRRRVHSPSGDAGDNVSDQGSELADTEDQDQVSFAGLLPLPVLLETVDLYFTYCHNQPYSFFHEGEFRRKLSDGKIPDHLLFAALASAVRFSTNPFFGDRTHEVAINYANRSWRSIVSTCFAANQVADIITVQTITLLGLFDFTAGKARHGSAWVKIGMAVRIAQDLKFMNEPASNLSYIEQEERRRVFWSVYLLDRLVSCGRGRPPGILDASCHLQLPADEITWRNGEARKTLTLEQLSNRTLVSREPQGPFAYVIVMAYTLSRGAQYMLQEFLGRDRVPPWDANSDFAAIESDLLHLETQLELHKPLMEKIAEHCSPDGKIDQPSVGPIVFSRALFHLCYCLLHHPFLLRRRLKSCHTAPPSHFLSRSFASSWDHATAMTELIRDTRNSGCIAQTSFYGYCTAVAGSVLALYLHRQDEATYLKSYSLLQDNIYFLDDISKYWRNVSSMSVALKSFVENSYRFSSLLNPLSTSSGSTSTPTASMSTPNSTNSSMPTLSAADEDTLWSLVDYSTISNASLAQGTHDQSPDANFWGALNTSWYDLFGGLGDETGAMGVGIATPGMMDGILNGYQTSNFLAQPSTQAGTGNADDGVNIIGPNVGQLR